MPLSEVELNAALRAQLEARRLSHRGLMALAILLVSLILLLLWLWYSPPPWLRAHAASGRAVVAYYSFPVLIALCLTGVLLWTELEKRKLIGLGIAFASVIACLAAVAQSWA